MGGFTVTSDQSERRLDRVLRGMYDDVPLGAIMKAIRKGTVRINGKRATGGERLVEGDVVFAPWAQEGKGPVVLSTQKDEAAGEKIETLFQNEWIRCVDKPAGLLSQPDRGSRDSLITRVWAELSWTRSDFRPTAIHRLDRNVSGIVAIALTAPVLRTLSALMREGQIKKTYRAVVLGPPPDFGEIDLPLSKDEKNNVVRVDEVAGRPSFTRFTTLCRGRHFSLVELELVTGRPHQARVHLSAIGHPILGDAKYGMDGVSRHRTKSKRFFLHAYSLAFPDSPALPSGIRGLSVCSPMPDEFIMPLKEENFTKKSEFFL